MKTLIVAATLLFTVSAHAELSYTQKQDISCKAIADAVVAAVGKHASLTFRDIRSIHSGATNLCKQSYNQASADYPLKKAKATAVGRGGEIAGKVVELSYDAYARNQK